MTKLASIFTALLLLFQSSSIHINDLLELDELVEHYQFHEAEYGDNFLEFLSKHYGELKLDHNQKHQEEHQEHEQLPFQHHCHSMLMMVFVISDGLKYEAQAEIPFEGTNNFRYSDSYSFLWGDMAFEPPKPA